MVSIYRNGERIMLYDTLIQEAKDLPEEIIAQTLIYMRFLRSQASENASSQASKKRSINPLARL